MAGIYLHIPFCKQACHYCDFHFSTQLGHQAAMVEAMRREMALRKGFFSPEVSLETLYFGGGTPSLLEPDEVARLLDAAAAHFRLNLKEVTLEANPDDLSLEKARQLRAAGINRLSIGIQTFDGALLQYFNRAHNAEEAERAVWNAAEAGFDNLTIDLMYGARSLSLKLWEEQLERALALPVQHISAYSLTVEAKTVFAHREKKGDAITLEEEEQAKQFERMQERLQAAGFIQYEVASFGKPGFFSQHNSNYWKGLPYLGIGPGAHGFDGKKRYSNLRNNPLYIKAIREGTPFSEDETLTAEEVLNERVLTGLRTIWGISRSELEMLHPNWLQLHAQTLDWLRQNAYLEENEDRIWLTPKGFILADSIAFQLFT
ncbi:oxygen-independent coproporphyrinogen III oxidase [Nitritalea halalkaliphila LW7]|uniref:Heme chaperone HemW n=1 Tax=Nitritalea halalkaliphila LW7 TaxID=1189621 RepID=I5C5X1_9BACT|nr:radical SAM family heme chaperone HemW [Nitritalea halalkaliphila]EIM77223.1 oxygen-independent coproporphyrinogen III oxidase [Nitritalea halalkaliphila LW7]